VSSFFSFRFFALSLVLSFVLFFYSGCLLALMTPSTHQSTLIL